MIKSFSTASFVSGFMLGALVVGAWLGSGGFSLPALSSSAPGAVTKSLPESGAISVGNQPAGSSVMVETVTVPPPGVWIAVREVNGSDLGNVLGAARVNGPQTQVTIQLLRATEPGLPYAVELYRDDGGETFDLATDSVYVDFETGLPVIARFMTTK